jgi:hypothetical protein
MLTYICERCEAETLRVYNGARVRNERLGIASRQVGLISGTFALRQK